MKKKEEELEMYKNYANIGERNAGESTATSNFMAETRITGAIVFKGNLNKFARMLKLAREDDGYIYHRVTSPDNKLKVIEEHERE
ncbi:MAG: hypothetical protein ACTSW1_00230 [Candidatus Hodarchaeales archaeon]